MNESEVDVGEVPVLAIVTVFDSFGWVTLSLVIKGVESVLGGHSHPRGVQIGAVSSVSSHL